MDPQEGPQADALIGQTIGNYRVTEKLGEGGMGSVYLAEHPTIGKKVALKVLHAQFSNNEEVAQRFFHEAKAVNNIGHPNIVDIVDYGMIDGFGKDKEQLFYFIMEYLAGQSLSTLIRNEAPLAPERALGIAMQVADALSASHKCGIVHRDLKPDNIMLQQRGRERDFVKLLDFGIAKVNDGAQPSRTRTGIVMGTPAYMSPEQCEGKANVDLRTDVYALGIVLYEMLAGRVPFIGEGYGEILVQHLTQTPLPPSSYRMLPPHVEVVVLKALEKRADMRYPNMDEMMRAMADPVGYVEAHGGPQQFLVRQIVPSNAPFQPVARITSLTPLPGSMQTPSGIYTTPAPGSMHGTPGMATPTTLGASAGEALPPKKSKAGFVVAGLLVVVGAAIAIGVVLSGGGGKDDSPQAGSAGAGSDTGAGSVAAVTPDAAVAEPPTPDAAVAATTPDAGATAPADAAVAEPTPDAAVATVATVDAGTEVAKKEWSVLVTSNVPATVYVGKKAIGKAPQTVVLDANAAEISVRASGYKTDRMKVERGKHEKFSAVLTKTASSTPSTGGNNDTRLERPF